MKWTPLAPTQDPANPTVDQAQACSKKTRRRRPRRRRCLLKDCERVYLPKRAQQRYCSEECARAAEKWRKWKARKRYRGTEKGKRRRREQNYRYRQRQREKQERERGSVSEGDHREFFFRDVIGRVAMSFFRSAEGHLCGDFAKKGVVERSNGSGNENADGASERRVVERVFR